MRKVVERTKTFLTISNSNLIQILHQFVNTHLGLNAIEIYASSAGGMLIVLLLIEHLSLIRICINVGERLVRKYLILPLVLRRHRFCGPWTGAEVVTAIIYVAANVFLVCFRASTRQKASANAAMLSTVNMTCLYLSWHWSQLADILGVSLQNVRRIHRSCGLMSLALEVLHFSALITDLTSTSLKTSKLLFGVVVDTSVSISSAGLQTFLTLRQGSSSAGLLTVWAVPFLRRSAYELFLRGHQLLALLHLYATWRHCPKSSSLSLLCVYISASSLAGSVAFEVCATLVRHRFFTSGFQEHVFRVWDP